jgi:cytochrome c biogenesis protein CcmG/thiol:disulfide interchange protein DsbE
MDTGARGTIWDRKITWLGLMAILLALGVAWIAASRVPVEEALARSDRPPAPGAGFAAPDFSLETRDGETMALADLRGQAVLLNFWATWCPPCRAEMPAIQRVYDKYRDQGFTVLAVDVGEGNAQVAAFVDERDLTFPILMDGDGAVSLRYQVRAMPSTFFIDQDGLIREVTLGGPMSEAFIESQVRELLTGEGDD